MSDIGKNILRWWGCALDRETSRGRGLAARLRRATSLEVLCEPEVHDLSKALGITDAPRLVRLVSILSEVREHDHRPLARFLGGTDPVMSPLRFQRLMRVSDDDLTDAMKRAIKMANNRCNVAGLGEDMMFWNESTRMRWCFNYFGADAPSKISEETTE